MIAVVAMTPYYVLKERNRRIGPNVLPLVSGIERLPIYGFSDKGPYDRFCANSPLALTPYSVTEEMLHLSLNVRRAHRIHFAAKSPFAVDSSAVLEFKCM